MIEYGSDFHYIEDCRITFGDENFYDYFPKATLYALGRHPIIHLCKQFNWRRIWIPEYFCYEVIEVIQRGGIVVALYTNNFTEEDTDVSLLEQIPFEEGDVLLRMNYFGMTPLTKCPKVPVPVIEDYSHALFNESVKHSQADWCVASLRKSLPLPEGGIVWSPKGHKLRMEPQDDCKNEEVAKRRWLAMSQKQQYLSRQDMNLKEEFRQSFFVTEGELGDISIASLDFRSRIFLENFDFRSWCKRKLENYKQLYNLIDKSTIRIPWLPKYGEVPFSFVFLCASSEARQVLRIRLIEKSIYPAVLWQVPETASSIVRDVSRRLLSLHCDARYSSEDILDLAKKINQSL